MGAVDYCRALREKSLRGRVTIPIEGSVVTCPGDGNMDKVVDQTDLDEWAKFAETTPGLTTGNAGGKGSWYDFGGPDDWSRPDGITDYIDEAIISANLGTHCE